MSGFSVYSAQKVFPFLFGRDANTMPPGNYLALCVADPTDENITANEVSAAWYARQAVGAWQAPTGTSTTTSNSNQVTFPAVTGSAVTVTHWGIYDAISGGNLLASDALTAAKVLNVNDVFVVNPGDLTLNFV